MSLQGVHIEVLTIKNYLFFNQIVTLDLNVGPSSDKNLVLVGGINGAGKTSLLNAIKYTITGLNPEQARRIYSESPTDSRLFFCLQFSWQGSRYRLSRTYDKNNEFLRTSRLEHDNGTESEEQKIRESIDTIFPPNLLDLFFFDVEEVKTLLTQNAAGGEIKQQIERLLGIELVRQAQEDALSLVRENDVSKDGKLVSAPTIEAEIDVKREQLQTTIENIQEAQILQNNLEQKLSTMPSSVNAQRIESEARAKENEVEKSSQQLNNLSNEAISYIKRAFVYELLWPLITQFESEDASRNQEQLELFDREKVIGVLHTKDDEIAKLGFSREQAEQLIDIIVGSPNTMMPELRAPYQKAESELGAARSYGKTASQLSESIGKEVQGREFLRQEVQRLKESLRQQHGDSEQRKFIEGYLEETKGKLLRLTGQKRELDVEKQELEIQLSVARQQSTEHHLKRSRETFAQLYVEVFSKMLELGRQRLLGRLGEKATEIFRSIDNDPNLYGEVSFDRAYQPLLRRGGRDWDPMNLSQGHQTVFAYSILGALMQLSGHSLPAIIDTPMMKLDSIHKSNVVAHLYPTLSHQVILFSSEEEVDDVYYPKLRPYVARDYVIKQRSTSVGQLATKSSYLEEGYFDFTKASL